MSNLGAITLVLCLLTGGCAATGRSPSPPGRLIDVGGWRLHVYCVGEARSGAPTVILESGSGDFSFDWSLVQSSAGKFGRVCSYDRAGAAWSDLGPRPRTMRQMSYELHMALRNGGIEPPYVMVGHSIGGLLVRQFSQDHPNDVAGVILVDSTHEDVRLNIGGQLRRVREDDAGRDIPPIRNRLADGERRLNEEEAANARAMAEFAGAPAIEPPYDKLPVEAQRWRLWALARPERFIADDDPFLPEELQMIHDARRAFSASLGDLPLVVVSRDLDRESAAGADPDLLAERRLLQEDLTRLSSNSRLIIAKDSGHHVHLDRPDIVVQAIREIVEAAGVNSPSR